MSNSNDNISDTAMMTCPNDDAMGIGKMSGGSFGARHYVANKYR